MTSPTKVQVDLKSPMLHAPVSLLSHSNAVQETTDPLLLPEGFWPNGVLLHISFMCPILFQMVATQHFVSIGQKCAVSGLSFMPEQQDQVCLGWVTGSLLPNVWKVLMTLLVQGI